VGQKADFISKWKPWLLWWLFFTIVNITAVFVYVTGVFDKVVEADFTKISFLVYGFFMLFTIKVGKDLYKVVKKSPLTEEQINNVCKSNERSWFFADAMVTYGMIGTVVGFIAMLGINLALNNKILLQSSMMTMMFNMGCALYTTATGIICGQLLRHQLFEFEQYLDTKASCGCKSKHTCGYEDDSETKI